jgi:RNA 3'-terminal phosphate cyclase (ATP)
MLRIDASIGEGGGQIVRSSLALAMLTGQGVLLENIRVKRKNPGLARQHLTAVEAATTVGDAEVHGATLGSTRLTFYPGKVRAGSYTFKIPGAGSTTLVLQTILMPLLFAEGPSALAIEGGTHNPLAPPVDFLIDAYMPLVSRMGPKLTGRLERYGFNPGGGGRFHVEILPPEALKPLEIIDRSTIVERKGRVVTSLMPRQIGQIECDELARLSKWPRENFTAESVQANGTGNVIVLTITSRDMTEVFTAFGEQGTPPEKLAKSAWMQAKQWEEWNVPIDEHLADQLILPLAISAARGGGGGAFRTSPLTEHSKTHLEIVQKFLGIQAKVDTARDKTVTVRLEPKAAG